MPDEKKPQVFISYSHKDRLVADQIFNMLSELKFNVWLDIHRLEPGKPLSSQLESGLKDSDYYLLVISENSNASNWVKREVATAIELADQNKLAVIPFVIDGAPVPFEFSGLLNINASASLKEGLKRLAAYFKDEDTPSIDVATDGHVIIRKGGELRPVSSRCILLLAQLKTRDLRHHIAKRLTLDDIRVIWFDLFETRMEDDVQIKNLPLSCVELIARCDREEQRQDLLDVLCRNHPKIAVTIT